MTAMVVFLKMMDINDNMKCKRKYVFIISTHNTKKFINIKMTALSIWI